MVAGSIAAAAILPMAAGTAAASSSASSAFPREVVTALAHLKATGSLSPTDRAALLRHPEVAAQVIEPQADTSLHKTVASPISTAKVKTGCRPVQDRYIVYKTLLGFKAFEWHNYLYYCIQKGGKIKRVERKTYLKKSDGTNYRSGYKINSEVGNKTAHYSSAYEEAVKNCIVNPKGGAQLCTRINYPYSKFVVNGKTGKVTYYFRKG
ncbi:hypothetical protein [Actinoallomurus sp. NPDC052274]|uniref:hypothetical protein n=1 Tax=Actinoallomurus sp. NPDC052274 TaxID=3155420 RepID=UPI0034343D4C